MFHPPFLLNLLLQTVDNWGTDATQCLVPGYGAPYLFTAGQMLGTWAPTSYPITYDQKGACGQVVFTSDLVDRSAPNNIYGRLYAWKDYGDNLYVTVSINATGFGPSSLVTSGFGANDGQFLHASPSLFNPNSPSGQVSVWSSFLVRKLYNGLKCRCILHFPSFSRFYLPLTFQILPPVWTTCCLLRLPDAL